MIKSIRKLLWIHVSCMCFIPEYLFQVGHSVARNDALLQHLNILNIFLLAMLKYQYFWKQELQPGSLTLLIAIHTLTV